MKVKRTFGGDRMIIRAPDQPIQSFPQPSVYQVASTAKGAVAAWVVFIPVGILLLLGFMLARRSRSTGSSHSLASFAGLSIALLVGGIFFFGLVGSRHVEVRTPAPLPVPDSTYLQNSQGQLVRVDGTAASTAANSTYVQDSQGRLVRVGPQSPTPQESLEQLWDRLAPLRIKLDAAKKPDEPKAPAAAKASTEPTEQNLLSAAETILSQADPIKQVRLINAAKAILEVSAKAAEAQSKQAAKAQLAAAKAPSEKVEKTKHFESAGEPVAVAKSKAEVVGAKPRPEWLDNPPKFVGNGYRVIAHTDPYSTVEECYDALRKQMRELVIDHIKERAKEVNPEHYAYVPPLEVMGVTDDYIKRELCPEEPYIETVESSVGDMLRAHMLLEFQERQDEELLDHWRAVARRNNVLGIAILSSIVVLSLALVYALLKIDTWTRGYYTKRLFLGVPAAIIAVFVFLAFVT
jgi:hypothetical protein